ncbi:WXG100 family type VII secretion target [Aeromicrobium wangtongii]|uniref:WXG100 family type VII secretion target n=1 Tax=Aeromicrobium wangtongii TaxID=2969247 RepID=A0ABY5M325_9ACTN|nr:WXG100 family type VII secretion target [Aeromicrobium wangtongii]MCD9198583.1 WXG100 family type VII secretion target [Aeromicrobium wangtongii]UUP12608.1 WXG100 family type VII secretion target [Aeromicrobium wangtongii]
MANMNVTYEEMRGAATQLRGGQNEIEVTLGKLMDLVRTLVEGGYVTDKSSKAFNVSYEDFDKGAKQAISGLEGMGEYLTKAAEALEQTDEQLASALKG